MVDKKRVEGDLDACPFPPDKKPPGKNFLSRSQYLYGEVFGNWKIVISILSAASLVLAFSILIVPPPIAPSISIPDSWGRTLPEYSYPPMEEVEWVPKYEVQRVQGGDLILEGNETLLVENCTYVLDGLLLVKDNARLVLRNAELYIKEKDGWSSDDILPFFVYIGFNNSAVFEAYNSSVFSEDIHPFMGFFRNSRAFLNSSRFDNVSMYGEEDSYVVITNSSLSCINVARNAYCKVIDSEISEIDSYSILDEMRDGYNLSARIWERCRVEFWNSTLQYLRIYVKNCDLSISKPLIGFLSYWNSYDLFKGERVVAFNVTFHDTNLTGPYWGITVVSGDLIVEKSSDVGSASVQNGSLQIISRSIGSAICMDGSLKASNSTIQTIQCIGNSFADIDDSTIWRLVLHCIGNSFADIDDSTIQFLAFEGGVQANISRSKAEMLFIDDFNGTMRFDMFMVEEVWLNEKFEAYMKGSVKFGENATRGEFDYAHGALTQNFEVWTHSGNRVLPNVPLSLYDKDDNLVWSGQTDREGRADFNISFCRWWYLYERYKYVNNFMNRWRLEATNGDLVQNATIGLFITETPVVFKFPSVSEPIFWRYRWPLSIVSVASIIVILVGVTINYKSKR